MTDFVNEMTLKILEMLITSAISNAVAYITGIVENLENKRLAYHLKKATDIVSQVVL